MLHKLYTPAGKALTAREDQIPWNVYPRPQLRRDSWINLNGYWDFAVSGQESFPAAYDHRIRVPFAPECLLSGIDEHFPEGSWLFYSRTVKLPKPAAGQLALLHIGAADQKTDVYVNGVHLGHQEGGYWPMTFDITPALTGAEFQLVIRIQDDLRDRAFPCGKQKQNRGGIWYTPVSGIWQTVWLEIVPRQYISALDIHAAPDKVRIRLIGAPLDGSVTIQTPAGEKVIPLRHGEAVYMPENPRLWSPEDPYLYNFTINAGEDRVQSYFAIRTLEIRSVNGIPRMCLNGKPYFFHGLLDQGYWSDGLYTPAAPECYEWDIVAMKKLGFNTLRKHIKIEAECFYYDCDRLGMIVFQDMVNNSTYSFLRDSALPTIGVQKFPDKFFNRDSRTREMFLTGMERTVIQLKNHPCICYWTIFNEGWGQFNSSAAYERLLELDRTRFVDSTSGWFRWGKTQVDSRHIYFKPLKLRVSKKPMVLSEFGGYSWKPAGHVFNSGDTYGYRKYEDQTAFVQALESLYLEQLLPLVKNGLCAAIYTQVSDVEDETNGLVTYDRQVEKLNPERMMAVSQALFSAFYQNL